MSPRSRGRRVLAGCLLVLALIAAACTDGAPATSSAAADEIPQVLTTGSTRDLVTAPQGRALIFETLVRDDGEGTPTPHLAEAWEESEDGLTVTFTLREDVIFHDGTPLNAESAEFALRFRAANAAWGPFLDDVDVIDDRTVALQLNEPYWRLLGDLAVEFTGSLVSPTSVDPPGDPDGVLIDYIGTGPFVVDSYGKDAESVLLRNDDYWGPMTELDQVVWQTIPDPYTQVLSLRAGELDTAGATEHHSALPYSEVAKFTRDDGFEVAFQSYGRFQVIDFNVDRAPTDDAGVRRAFNLAIDRDAMVATLFEGLAEPATTLSPRQDVWQWGPQASIEGFDLDVAEAERLLDAAGWERADDATFRTRGDDTLTVELLVPFGEANADVVSLFVQSELRKIGVEVQVTTLESSAASERRGDGEYHMYVHHTCGMATMGCLGPDGKYTSGYGITGVYSSPEVDALTSEAFTGPPDQRRAAFDDIWAILHDEAVSIPLYDIAKPIVSRAGVEGVGFGPTMFTMDLAEASIATTSR